MGQCLIRAGIWMVQVATKTDAELSREADSIIGGIQSEQDHPTSMLAAYLGHRFDRVERAKEDSGVKYKLLEDLRQWEGQYDEETSQRLQKQGGTTIYYKITQQKCDTLNAWINYVLEGLSENKIWDLDPTPKPELPMIKMQELKQEGMQMFQQQMQQMHQPGQPPPDPEHVQGMLYDFLVKRSAEEMRIAREASEDSAKNMKACMLDQQIQGEYRKALKQFVHHFSIFKNAFMKGPFIKYQRKLEWGPDFEPVVRRVPCMTWECVSPFDMFPDPSAKTLNDGDLFERVRYTREDLEDMIGLEGYNDDAIRFVLSKYAGSGQPVSSTITNVSTSSIDDQRGQLEERSWYGYRNNAEGYIYEGVVFWGTVSGKKLQEWEFKGVKPKEYETYEINAIMVGNTVIRTALNPHPLGHRYYTTSSFKPIPGAIWGISLPEVLRDIQKSANSVQRALINNISISSGPQVLIDLAQLPTGSKISNLQPWKIWQIDSRGNPNAKFPGVGFVNVPNNADTLIGVLNDLEQKASETSQIPNFAHGGTDNFGPAGSTATGMSILQNNATKGMRNVIREITTRAIKPQIQMQFDWNMLYNPDRSIKGDVKIDVNGPISILEKEATQAKRMEFLQFTANPIDQALIGNTRRANVLRKMTRGLDMPDDQVVKPREMLEVEEKQAMEQQDQMMQMEKQKLEAEQASQQTADVVSIEKVHNDKEAELLKNEVDIMKIQASNPEFNVGRSALQAHNLSQGREEENQRKEDEHLQVYHPGLWQKRQDLMTEQMKASGMLELESMAQAEVSP